MVSWGKPFTLGEICNRSSIGITHQVWQLLQLIPSRLRRRCRHDSPQFLAQLLNVAGLAQKIKHSHRERSGRGLGASNHQCKALVGQVTRALEVIGQAGAGQFLHHRSGLARRLAVLNVDHLFVNELFLVHQGKGIGTEFLNQEARHTVHRRLEPGDEACQVTQSEEPVHSISDVLVEILLIKIARMNAKDVFVDDVRSQCGEARVQGQHFVSLLGLFHVGHQLVEIFLEILFHARDSALGKELLDWGSTHTMDFGANA